MLSLDQLEMFKAAAECGSFSAAARKLRKGVSTVSTAVINLEEYLGVQLFDRATRKPTLTVEGERLLARAKVLFSEVSRIESSLTLKDKDVESLFKIGVGELVPSNFFEVPCEKLSQRYVDTRVRIERAEPEALIEGLKTKRFDVVLLAHYGQPDVIYNAIGVGFIEMVLVCSPDSHLTDLGIVEAQTLFLQRQIVCLSLVRNPMLSNTLIYSPDLWETSSIEDMVKLIEQGVGWGCIPKELAQERIALGTLVQFQSDLVNVSLTIPVDMIELASEEVGPVHDFFVEQFIRSQ